MLYALQGRDDPYLEIVDKYDRDRSQGQRASDLYADAFGKLQYGMAETQADLLGVVYETYGMASDAFGQYFTPHNASRMNAEMALHDLDTATVQTRREQDDPVTIQDPACGSGRLLIVAAQQYPDAQYWGVDKSAACAKMTALNFCLYNLDGVVVHGDALAMESFNTWQTTRSVLGGAVEELPDAEPFTDSRGSVGEDGTGDKNRADPSSDVTGSSDVTVQRDLGEFQ